MSTDDVLGRSDKITLREHVSDGKEGEGKEEGSGKRLWKEPGVRRG